LFIKRNTQFSVRLGAIRRLENARAGLAIPDEWRLYDAGGKPLSADLDLTALLCREGQARKGYGFLQGR
jgi:hypothetical protein